MKKKIIGLFLIVLSSVTFSLKVSPSVLEGNIVGKELFKEISVINDSAVTKRYEINVTKPEDTVKDEYYLGDSMQVFPKVVSLKPGESKKVRILIEDSPNFKDGEYRAYILLEEMKNIGSKGVQFKMNIRTSVYAIKGNLNESAKIEGNKIVNTGNSSLRLMEDVNGEMKNIFIPRGGSIDKSVLKGGSKIINKRTEEEITLN